MIDSYVVLNTDTKHFCHCVEKSDIAYHMIDSYVDLISDNKHWCYLVLPIDIENPYRLSNCLYRYISIYIGFLATNF